MQEYDIKGCKSLIAAIILRAMLDYCDDITTKDRSPKSYFLSEDFERHVSYLGMNVTGQELIDMIDSGRIGKKRIQNLLSV